MNSPCANGAGHFVGEIDGEPGYPLGTEEAGNTALNEGFAAYFAASVWNDREEQNQSCRCMGYACYERVRAFDYCYTDLGFEHRLLTGFERDWLSAFWEIERTGGCGIDFDHTVDIIADADPAGWAHDDGHREIVTHVSLGLNWADYTCFAETFTDRIRF